MTSVAGGNTASFHQTTNSTSNAPVYVPSNRAIHSQYPGHAGNYANTQNGWPAESAFGNYKKINLFKFTLMNKEQNLMIYIVHELMAFR